MEYMTIVKEKGILVGTVESKRTAMKEKNEKAKKAVDGDDDSSALSSFMSENIQKEKVKKKVQLVENVKLSMEVCCTQSIVTFFCLQRIHGLETLKHCVTS